jgi:hypothetical protein
MAAYHYYVVIQSAAFAIVTQSMAILVTSDIIHRSVFLHTLRVVIYTATVLTFYYAAWYSYKLTGQYGYRGACPARCKFQSYQATWAMIIVLGAPIYLFIILDLFRRLDRKWKEHKNIDIHEHNRQNHSKIHELWHRGWKVGMDHGRLLAWVYCIVDLTIGLYGFISGWMVQSYSGLILTADFDENSWGFGQLVAIILISLPFLTALEEFIGDFTLSLYTK